MYIAVVLILLGWALAFASRGLWIYTGVMAIVFHVRVALFEEPWLAQRYGAAWMAYQAAVPRWLFPLRRSRAEGPRRRAS
jgi:protein-S-isoprenylcysteine O-methyltransferase Ste14